MYYNIIHFRHRGKNRIFAMLGKMGDTALSLRSRPSRRTEAREKENHIRKLFSLSDDDSTSNQSDDDSTSLSYILVLQTIASLMHWWS